MFVGTRVPLRNLFDYLERGHGIDEFLDAFPFGIQGTGDCYSRERARGFDGRCTCCSMNNCRGTLPEKSAGTMSALFSSADGPGFRTVSDFVLLRMRVLMF